MKLNSTFSLIILTLLASACGSDLDTSAECSGKCDGLVPSLEPVSREVVVTTCKLVDTTVTCSQFLETDPLGLGRSSTGRLGSNSKVKILVSPLQGSDFESNQSESVSFDLSTLDWESDTKVMIHAEADVAYEYTSGTASYSYFHFSVSQEVSVEELREGVDVMAPWSVWELTFFAEDPRKIVVAEFVFDYRIGDRRLRFDPWINLSKGAQTMRVIGEDDKPVIFKPSSGTKDLEIPSPGVYVFDGQNIRPATEDDFRF